jgi:hypothetical protein
MKEGSMRVSDITRLDPEFITIKEACRAGHVELVHEGKGKGDPHLYRLKTVGKKGTLSNYNTSLP